MSLVLATHAYAWEAVLIWFFLSFSSNATLEGDRTEPNKTIPHVHKLARLKNARLEFGGSRPLKRGPQNYTYLGSPM